MKKTLFLMTALANGFFANAQNDSIAESDNYENDYNKWSIELGAGGNKPIDPFAIGYSSSDPAKFLNFTQADHFNLGVRYMFNTKFGLKVDGAFDKVRNLDGSESPVFETQQIRLGVQGVLNLGRVLSFEQFTSRFNLLLHFGFQGSQLTPKTGGNANVPELNGGLIYGVTPQIRITDRIALNFDITMMNNVRQHYTWDGKVNALDGNAQNRYNNLTGRMLNSSVGIQIYLGRNDKHADWYADEVQATQNNAPQTIDNTTQEENLFGILARLDELEKCTNDSDQDGVNDCIDEEEKTPAGVFVDTKGKTKVIKDGVDGTTTIVTKENPTVIQKGSLLNIFYDVNKDTPNAGSVGDVSLIIAYLISNPEAKIKLIGYADSRGGAATNQALSQRRAKNLTAMVVAKGINPSRVRFDGFGVERKVANPTKEQMDYARRTEVIVE